jgi:hypothetical protein
MIASHPMTTLQCPMVECRRRVDLDTVPVPPEQPVAPPCLHYIAAWDEPGGHLGGMAEAVLWGLRGNRELAIRNLRPKDVAAERIAVTRPALEASARAFAHEVTSDGRGALFGDVHERNRVAFDFAQHILGPDPMAPAQ